MAQCGCTQRCPTTVLWHDRVQLLHSVVWSIQSDWCTISGEYKSSVQMLALAIVSLLQSHRYNHTAAVSLLQSHCYGLIATFSSTSCAYALCNFVSATVTMLACPILKRHLQLNVAGFCHVAVYSKTTALMQGVWSRALGLPIERPKSFTMEALEKKVGAK